MAEEFNLSVENEVYDISFNEETSEIIVDIQDNVTAINVDFHQGYYPLPNDIDLIGYYTKVESDARYKPISYTPTWSEVSGKPTTFTPSAHTHTISEVINLQSTLDNKEDKLNAVNLGEILDTQLSIKMTPSADDDIVILDSITGDAATVKFSSFGGNVDLSNLVPYTGATQDVNIASNYFKTSKGFDFTKDLDNFFKVYSDNNIINFEFVSTLFYGNDYYKKLNFSLNHEDGLNFTQEDSIGYNEFNITTNNTYSLKKFVTEEGYEITGGTSSQYLMADGSTSTLPTDLIRGTGTTNYIPKFSASGTLANSIVYDNGASVSIGDTISDARLRVKAKGSNATDIAFRVRNSANTQDFLVVNGAGDVYNKGALGESTNLFYGENIGRVANGVGNVGFGSQSLRLLSTGTFNSSFGYQALNSLTTGVENTAIGQASLQLISASNQNTAIGRASMPNLTSGNQNTAIGNNSGRFIADGTTNLSSSTSSLFLGYNTKASANNVTNEIVIGGNATGNGNNSVTLGNDSITKTILKGNVGIEITSPSEKLEIVGYAKATGFKVANGTATQSLTANGGVFDLTAKADLENGKIPATQLPSYVDDVLEFANLASFPATGESGKIYIAIDTNLTYRWGGSSYVVMSSSLALGETSSTAYRGDRGKIAYDHSQLTGNPHNTTKSDIGLGNVPNIDATNPTNIVQTSSYRFVTDSEKTNLSTAYTHSQATGNPHNTKLEELTDLGSETTTIVDTDIILKKEAVGGLWRKITFANFKSWFTTELAKKINIGVDTFFNFKNISAMALSDFRSITPDIETIYFTEEQNGTGWQQVRYNGLGITIPATTETLISLTNENFIELDSDSTFNLIDVANTKINGIFEKDFVIIKFNAGVVTPATANQWFKVILKINGVQTAVSPVFYLTETSGTVEQIAHNFALNVTTEMLTNGATLHLKTSTSMTFNNPAISVVRVHKSTNANF